MSAQTDQWKQAERPYCITRYSKSAGRYLPHGKARYATIAEACAECARISDLPSNLGKMLFVDYAGAYEGGAK